MKKKSGYILVLALILTSLSVLLISTVLFKSSMLARYAVVYIQREKAKTLARSGIELAISQLSNLMPKEDEEKKNGAGQGAQKDGEKEDPQKEYYAKLFSIINRWQTFKVNEDDFDVVDAEIKIYIACEQGKINLGQFYDFKKDSFISDGINGQKVGEYIFSQLGEQIQQKKLLNSFESFMKKSSYPLQDVSELLGAKEFMPFKSFMFVPFGGGKKEAKLKGDSKNKSMYLMDVFTLETNNIKLDPLVLSESVCVLVGFDRQSTVDGKKWVKNLPTGTINWETDWDKVLAPMYKKEYKALPDEVKKLLTLQSDSLVFSVIVQASIGKLTQKMYAILHNDKQLNQYKIQKLYWL